MPGAYDDFLAEAADEHLDQLERLLARPEAPDPEQLARLASGVLTSAQRAGAETVATVAERLEDAARAVQSGSVAWSQELRSLSARTVADLKLLMRALNRWGAEEERRVRAAIERWDDHEGSGGEAELPLLEDDRAQAPPVPIASLFYNDDGPHVVEEGEADVVPIETLLLRGDAALREAMSLRPEFESIARGDAMPERPLADLVQELFELLALAEEDGGARS